MKWTEAQQSAIGARGSNLLVSAAAGSGKTAVLTERIVSLVREGARIDELLVVTFTKAAAAEMRERILTTLHDAGAADRRLAAQALGVERADIITLHSFCGKLCREYFQAAGIDPTFRVADTAEISGIREQALEEALTACYEDREEAFAYAAECFSQQGLMEAVPALYTFLLARPDPWSWLEEAVEAHEVTEAGLAASTWVGVLVERCARRARTAVSAYRELVEFARQKEVMVAFAEGEAAKAEAYAQAAEAGYASLSACPKTVFERRPSKKKDMDPEAVDAFAQLRDRAKKLLQSAQEDLDMLASLALNAEDERDVRLALAGLADAARLYHQRFEALKQEKNVLDFSDLEHCALRILGDEDIAASVRAKYRHVFVDEYQDSSLLQEAILQRVARGDNLFMVGDVKQSIYRFRLADPGLFLGKLQTFEHGEGARNRRIDLNANFRSVSTVLDGVNEVFRGVFVGGTMEIPYEPEDWLYLGREEGKTPPAPVELHVLSEAAESQEGEEAFTAEELSPEDRKAIRQEAECIAERILDLRRQSEGRYSHRDMAILMRTVRGKATYVMEALRAHGIPAWSDLGEDALDRCEIQAVLAILETINNFHQDVPLLAALRGPAMGLTDDLLAAIRIEQPEGTIAQAVLAYAQREDALGMALRAFVERIRGWGLDAQVLPLDRLFRQIYDQTGHYAASGAMPDGDIRQGNLRMLAEHAGNYQRTQGGGLGGFLRYLERLKAHEGITAHELGERDDVVRILSIHKSKGLQFPVVFVAGLGRQFRQMDAQKPLLMDAGLGLGMAHVDPALRTKRATLSQTAILERKRQEDVAEEARVLYVAMTRAQERLILLGSLKASDGEEGTSSREAGDAKSMLDWILPAAVRCPETFSLVRHTRQPIVRHEGAPKHIRRFVEEIRGLPPPQEDSDVSRRLSWRPAQVRRLPLKISVSAVVRAEAKAGEREELPADLSDVPKRPLFMERQGLTATERGDALHAFLRALPLETQDIEAACRMMVEKGILSEEQAESLRGSTLKRIVEGPLWQRMRAAETLHREWPFNLRVERDGQRTLLQGVIDCCFLEAGAWVLVDYKSDRAKDTDELAAHYRPQLALYAQALREMTGIPVRERLLYLIERDEVLVV